MLGCWEEEGAAAEAEGVCLEVLGIYWVAEGEPLAAAAEVEETCFRTF